MKKKTSNRKLFCLHFENNWKKGFRFDHISTTNSNVAWGKIESNWFRYNFDSEVRIHTCNQCLYENSHYHWKIKNNNNHLAKPIYSRINNSRMNEKKKSKKKRNSYFSLFELFEPKKKKQMNEVSHSNKILKCFKSFRNEKKMEKKKKKNYPNEHQ